MKKILYIIVFLSAFYSFCQDKEEIEALLNVACKEIVPEDFAYFNLVDSTFVIKMYAEPPFTKTFSEKYPDFDLAEFEAKSAKAVILGLNQFNIEKARIYSYKNIPKYAVNTRVVRIFKFDISQKERDSMEQHKSYNEVIIYPKRHWSDKRISKEAARKWDEYDKSITKENKEYYKISTPLFSANKKYALLQIDNAASGKKYIFIKENGEWKLIYEYGYWVS